MNIFRVFGNEARTACFEHMLLKNKVGIVWDKSFGTHVPHAFVFRREWLETDENLEKLRERLPKFLDSVAKQGFKTKVIYIHTDCSEEENLPIFQLFSEITHPYFDYVVIFCDDSVSLKK